MPTNERVREIIERRHPRPDPSAGNQRDEEEALRHALEFLVGEIPGVGATLDGWRMLHVVEEADSYLRAVGLMYVLPTGELPVEVVLDREATSLAYELRVGTGGGSWAAFSESKRWKSVHLYATREAQAAWDWTDTLSGTLHLNRDQQNRQASRQVP